MFKISVGIGWSVLKLIYLEYFKLSDAERFVIDSVRNNKIVLSNMIRQYYLDSAENDGLDISVIQDYFASVMYEDESSVETEDGGDYLESFRLFFKNYGPFDAKAIISDKNELTVSKKVCQFQYDIETAYQEYEKETSPFRLYAVPTNYHLQKGSNGKNYARWLKNVLEGEKTITLIDRHIFNSEYAQRCLLDYYFEAINTGSNVDIYCSNRQEERNQYLISEAIKNAEERGINVRIFLCEGMHDRHIVTSDLDIAIGIGLGVADKKDRITNNTVVTVGRRLQSNVEYVENLAGDVVRCLS